MTTPEHMHVPMCGRKMREVQARLATHWEVAMVVAVVVAM